MARTGVRPVPEKLDVRPLTIFGIEGHLHRRNDVIFKPSLQSMPGVCSANQQTLVFFGGDIQNLSHLMDPTDPEKDYQAWCLEATAQRLSEEFPSCHVVVIKPSRVAFEDISCYDNFVETNAIGIPTYYYHYISLLHLEKMLKYISYALRQKDSDVLFKMLLQTETESKLQDQQDIEVGSAWQYDNMSDERKRLLIKWQKKLRLDKYPLTLVAFSKGCVVLNQFLYEFHYARGLEPNHQDSRFIERIQDMYWLDSGNCGSQVYLTSKGLLQTLSVLKISIHVHVSKYMTEDRKRPWIKEQLNEFIEGIKATKGCVTQFCHPSSVEDLNSHFSVLLWFKHVERNINTIDSLNGRLAGELPPVPERSVLVAPPPVEARFRHKYPKAIVLTKSQTSPYLDLRIIFPKNINRDSHPGATNLRRYFHSPPMQYEETNELERHETLSSNRQPMYCTVGFSDETPREYTHLLLNEGYNTIDGSFLQQASSHTNNDDLYNYTTFESVVALTDKRNPFRIHVYNHVLNSENKNNEGEEPLPDALDAGHATSNGATEPAIPTASPRSEVSNTNSDTSGSDSDDADSTSDASASDSDSSVHQRAMSHAARSTPIAQSDVAQNSVAPRPDTPRAQVRARDEGDECPRYNLRKRIKRSYDENQCD